MAKRNNRFSLTPVSKLKDIRPVGYMYAHCNCRTVIMPPLYRGTLTDTAIRPFVYLSDCPMAQLPEVRICPAIGTLATCSLAMCRLQARPRTDVDPPRVELPSAGAYRLAVPGAITCLFRHAPASTVSLSTPVYTVGSLIML